MSLPVKMAKTIGKYSEDPKENARQTQELERNVEQGLKNAEARIVQLESDLAALQAAVAGYHP